MTVEVSGIADNLLSGNLALVLQARFEMVAVDEDRQPTSIHRAGLNRGH